MIVKIFFVVILIAQAMRPAAFAQDQAADPKQCANGAGTSSNQNLSDKLSQSNGVICPPNVDSGIKKPTPPAGRMPVIPPPGNPNVQPK